MSCDRWRDPIGEFVVQKKHLPAVAGRMTERRDLCPICAKHRGTGPLASPVVRADDLVVVTHRAADGEWARPGYLFVEPRRHIATLDRLDDAETVALARTVRSAITALRQVLRPGHVFTFVAGLSVDHLHQHVFTRPPATPADVPWHDADSPAAPRIPAADLGGLCAELASAMPD